MHERRLRKRNVIEVVCRNCGYHWETKPARWKSMQYITKNGKEKKIVRCPMCGVGIGLSKESVAKIVRASRDNIENYSLSQRTR